jgi:hypothetical protein
MPDTNHGRLVHYTNSAETVASIVRHGFLLVPNKRHLINALLGQQVFTDREPQEFGMVSFTQLPVGEATAHRERFGRFGIMVTWEWALEHDAQRVIYVDHRGPTAKTFAWLFRLAKQELDRATGGAPDEMTLTNKAFAFMSKSNMYPHLLTLYEYMEPEANSTQIEWRIVNKLPQHHDLGKPRAELIRELLTTAKLWNSFGCVPVGPNDIHAFICPRGSKADLAALLPDEFKTVPILTYRTVGKISRLGKARDRALFAHRGRERTVVVEKDPPPETIWLRHDRDGAYRLPEVGRMWGARFYQDELASGIQVFVQYQSPTGLLCQLVMPILDALYLLNLLKAIQHDGGLDPLNPSNDAGR